jgi:hypothetical protein
MPSRTKSRARAAAARLRAAASCGMVIGRL